MAMEEPDITSINPTISVIIPAYNQARYISTAIQSVLGQTYPHFELVVVDDGSTDETPRILSSIQDPRLRVVTQSNAGLSAARNTGLRESSAPLVTFLDADDYFFPDKLEVLWHYLEEHPEIGLVAGRVRYIDHLGNTIFEPVESSTKLGLPDLLFQNPICVSGVLLWRKWLDRVGVFDESLRACEDLDLWLRLASAGCQMAWVDYPVVAYRIHPGQMTRQAERMRKAIFTVLDKLFDQPKLPASLMAYNKIAYASGFVHAAAFEYLSGEVEKGRLDLAEAIRLDPTLKDDHYKRLLEFLVGWANDPRSADPANFLQRVVSTPPSGHPGLLIQLRRAVADLLLGSLFKSSQEEWRNRRWDLLKVVLYKPDWLFNRGVLRMLLAAWL
jgi:glycosyltransferase involved in cell wall biosynthesis